MESEGSESGALSSLVPQVVPGRCVICKKGPQEVEDGLTLCAGCKCVAYCSPRCRQTDRKYHRRVCLRWQETRERLKKEPRPKGTPKDIKKRTAEAILKVHDGELLQLAFHEACMLCRTTTDELEQCPECQVVYGCKQHPPASIPHQCDQLRLVLDCEIIHACTAYRPSAYMPTSQVLTIPGDFSSDLCRPVSCCSSKTKPKNTKKLSELEKSESVSAYQNFALNWIKDWDQQTPGQKAIEQTNLAVPLTTLYALQKGISDLIAKESLAIHIVGARLNEVISVAAFEELLHLLPNLKTMDLLLNGPDLSAEDAEDPDYIQEQDVCDTCYEKDREMSVMFGIGTYQDNVCLTPLKQKSKPIEGKLTEAPDIAILPNAGLFLYDSWKPCVEMLLKAKVLTCVTAHDLRDLECDLKVVNSIAKDVEIVLPPQLNPFRGGVPIRRPEDLTDVFYRNNHVMVFRGTK